MAKKCKSCSANVGAFPQGQELEQLGAALAGAVASRVVKNKVLTKLPFMEKNPLISDIVRAGLGAYLAGMEGGGPLAKPFGVGMAVDAGLSAIQGIGGEKVKPFLGAFVEQYGNIAPAPFPSLSGTEYLGQDGAPLPFPSLSGTEYLGQDGAPLPFHSLSGTEYVGETMSMGEIVVD